MGVRIQNGTDDMPGRQCCESGFTLIEMMIAVAIIGIASVIAVPSIGEWLARYELKQGMSEIASDMNLAKLVAMNRNRQAAVTVQMAGAMVQVSGTSAGTEVFAPRLLMSRVNALPGGTATVNFSSMGLSTATAAQTIQIQNDKGLIYSLSILPSGKVTWCAKATCP